MEKSLIDKIPEGRPRLLFLQRLKEMSSTANDHTYQLINILIKHSYRQLLDSRDFYVLAMFSQSPLVWLSKLDDPDFKDKFWGEMSVSFNDEEKNSLHPTDIKIFDLVKETLG